MIYWQLFYTFFKIGLFGFGGGAAMLPLIQFEMVEHYGWLTLEEFTNMVAVSQVTPGPVGINCATYAGFLATDSVLGAALATFAIVLPSLILMLLVARVLTKFKDNFYVESTLCGLRPAVVGLIAAAALLMMNSENFGENCADWTSWAIFACAFVCVKFLNWSPILVIAAAAVFGVIVY